MKLQKIPEKLVCLGLMATALVVYLLTLSQGACPGASSTLIVTHGGFVPRLSPASPLWTSLVAVVRMISGDNFVFILNLISALFAVISVGLVFSLVSNGVLIFINELSHTEKRLRIAATLAGVVAGGTLAFCIPFWIVANRAHTATFDIMLLLITARILLAYMDYGKLWIALVFSFIFGLGVVEFSTFIVLAPVFGAWLLYIMWKRDVLRLSVALALVACAVLGLLAYLLAAWGFYKTPGYELMKYGGFFDIVWQMWRSQYQVISRGLRIEGWIIILFVSVVPWLAMLSVIRRGLNDERDKGLYFLHLIITAIVIAVLLNTKIAPYKIVGQQNLLVTPYLLISMVYGYLAVYLYLLPCGWGRNPDAALTRFFRNVFGWILVLPLVAVLGYTAVTNSSEASTKQAGFADVYADELINSLDGREWLISNGLLDDNIMLAASRKNVPLKIINLRSGGSSVYLDYLSGLFETPRMQNLAKIGIPALLSEWMESDPEITSKIVIMDMPDIWVRYGFEAVPNNLVFLGAQDISKIDVNALLSTSEKFHERYNLVLGQWEDLLSDNIIYNYGKRHAGLVANNLGVLLEDSNRNEDAFGAYKSAREIDPDNISALLNMSAMVAAGDAEDESGDIQRAVEELESDVDKKYHVWDLSRYYGFVRSPEAFADMGLTWARSGQAGMAISELERAEKMMPDESKGQIRQLMTDILMSENRTSESAKIYKSILLDDKQNSEALLGMVAVCMGQKKYRKADQYLSLAEKSGVPVEQIQLQRSLINYMTGNTTKAKEILNNLLLENNKLLRGWVLLANIAFSENDEKVFEKCLRRIESIEHDRGYFGSLLRARRAIKLRQYEEGAEYYEMALSRNPSNSQIREKLLRLDMSLGRKESVKRHVKTLLLENSNHPLALYVRGSLQIAEGDFDLAEDSLRLSLRSSRSMLALNDLAWLVQNKGNYEEAEKLINEALSFSEKQPSLWDTKGSILMGLKRYDEAVDAFGRSLAILDIPSVRLHMGEAQLALGNKEAVKAIIELVQPMEEGLRPEDREVLAKLQIGVK